MNVREIIRKLVKEELTATIKMGQVIAFDAKKFTCDVDLITEVDISSVRIKAAVDQELTGMLIEPEKGSIVLIGLIDGNNSNAVVLAFTQIQNFSLFAKQKVSFQGDNLGGLVIAKSVSDEIKEIKNEINKLKGIFNTWIVAPDGGASLKALLVSQFSTQLTIKEQSHFESKKTSHGQ